VAAKVLLVVAHPVIAAGIETLLKLDGEYEIRRVVSVAEAMKQQPWGPEVALIDGTLLAGYGDVRIGAPSFVLSGSERDGRQLARKLDDARGWLRKDATGAELTKAIRSALDSESGGPAGGVGTLAIIGIVISSAIALTLVAYLIWLALY
jgi:DNA-binding NarL/FixJ family response regulator